MTMQNIPLGKLEMSPLNVRKMRSKEAVERMAASIEAHGVLQNLRVHETANGHYGAAIGGTRLAALNLLAEQGRSAAGVRVTPDYPVICEVRPADDPTLIEASLTENVVRDEMHPADQFDAFKKLADDGQGNETIAARFGTTSRVVEQRLKLAVVSPKLIAAYRKDEMTLDQLMAFTISDSHKTQEKIWRDLPQWEKDRGDGESIRAQLTEKHIDASSNALAKFVGIEAYEAAGGGIVRDLFDDEGQGYLTNAKLLNRLADEKLQALAEPTRSQGWKWIEIKPDWSWKDEQKIQRVTASLTKEQRAEIAGYSAEQERLAENSEGENDLSPAEQQKWDDLEGQIAAVRAEAGFTLTQKANAGVVITINQHSGKPEIKYGLVKPEDARAAKKAEAATTGKEATKPNGKAEGATPGMSAALVEELTAHRTVAMQAKLAGNQEVAMAAVAHALLNHGEGSVLQISIQQPNLSVIGDGLAKTPAAKELAGAVREATKGMPKDSAKQFAWLLQQSPTRVAAIIAATVAPAVNAVERKFNGANRQAADQLATALKLDVSQFWQATAEGFFSRVSKDQVLAAVTEAAGEDAAKKMVGMKKAEIAVAAEKAVRGKGYLPAILANG